MEVIAKQSKDGFLSTFFPFVLNGKELALYSSKGMYTRIMELPSCHDLGGEDKNNVENEKNFCPAEFYIPFYRKLIDPNEKYLEMWLTGDECFDSKNFPADSILEPIQYCNYGFVAGCFWGDDSSLKIQSLDLSQADNGIIKRRETFGRLELPHNLSLKDAINMRNWEPQSPQIGIAHTLWVYLQL